MDALEFCLLFSMLERKMGCSMDSSIVEMIYDMYRGTYENYTLFELIDMLQCNGISIDCPLNKRRIICMMEEKNISLPQKDISECMEPTKWFVAKDICLCDYVIFSNTATYMGMCCNDLIRMEDGTLYSISNIYICPPIIRFSDGLSFEIVEIYKRVSPLPVDDDWEDRTNVVIFEDGNVFDVQDIYDSVEPWNGRLLDDYMVVATDMETLDQFAFKLKDFMKRLDEEDVTYERHCFRLVGM